jgi:hypothetical protein
VSLVFHGNQLKITEKAGKLSVSQKDLNDALIDGIKAVESVYGKFTAPKLDIEIESHFYDDSTFGSAHGTEEIRWYIGSKVTPSELRHDWVMTHEMFHLGFPDLPEKANWICEGLSTYLEPLSRGRTGNLTPEGMWSRLLDGLHDGNANSASDPGLNFETVYRRYYWGGALYWFLIDLEIRKTSAGKRTLDDLLKAIFHDGGDGDEDWTLEYLFKFSEKTVGSPLLKQLYEAFGPKPSKQDLPSLFKSLGVSEKAGKISFDDTAPLAKIRRSLIGQKEK